MPDPFPTEAYIRECTQPEVAEKLREEWKRRGPQHGDWVHDTIGGDTFILLEASAFWLRNGLVGMPEGWIPLFTLRQLWRMLKERGFSVVLRDEPDGCNCEIYDYKTEEHHHGDGPDPETAMLRAWLEAGKDG